MHLLRKALLIAVLFSAVIIPAFCAPASEVRLGVLKGPTGIGACRLLSLNEQGQSRNRYSVTLLSEATDMVASLASGQLDIAALPTNAAASLYNKTNGDVRLAALNTAGVLYILENGDSIKSVADLRGKTVYAVGQGSNPEYVLRFILSQNGIDPQKDIDLVFMDSAELTTRAAAGMVEICMLPVPAVTTVLMKNGAMRIALDLTQQWDSLNTPGILTMGCIAVRTEYAEKHPIEVMAFLDEYGSSISFTKENPAMAAELCEKYGIVPSAAIAEMAIPDCNLIFISGKDIRPAIEGYLNVLYEFNPKSIGGKMPDDDFYSLGDF